jgi:hypothetical protein
MIDNGNYSDEEILLYSEDEEIILTPNTIVYKSEQTNEIDEIDEIMLLFIYIISYLFDFIYVSFIKIIAFYW